VKPTLALAASLLASTAGPVGAAADGDCPGLLRHTFGTLQGGTQDLCAYRGKVLLVVNTASFCGFTGQYEGLEALHEKFKDRGLVVLGFPSNDFGGQEPGSNQQIAAFCRRTYDIQFPMFEKSSVSGPAANPFFRELSARSGESPRWNFHKYLVDSSGKQVLSFASNVDPTSASLASRIEMLLSSRAQTVRGAR
jgi:glutathione peroxidase